MKTRAARDDCCKKDYYYYDRDAFDREYISLILANTSPFHVGKKWGGSEKRGKF